MCCIAQALGYVEADPTFDVEGIDAAHKLVILASLAFGILQFDQAYTEGIAKISRDDVEYAEQLGYRSNTWVWLARLTRVLSCVFIQR